MRWLIGLDWGTSSLRATLFDGAGATHEVRQRPWGIRHLPEGGYAAALSTICNGWPTAPLLAAGMVGSRQGWREAPYVDAPADLQSLTAACVQVALDDGQALHIVPGVRDGSGPDLMRGEETQVMGALALRPALAARALFVLPGTHSKWVRVRNGAIEHLHTAMTGELFAMLRTHSILGAGLDAPAADAGPEAFDEAAFGAGVQAARDSGAAGALSRLFSARTLMLEGNLATNAVPDYLSGLLVGEEFRAARAAGWLEDDDAPVLLGDDALCARYRRAAMESGLHEPAYVADASTRGLWQIAVAAGLATPEPQLSGMSG